MRYIIRASYIDVRRASTGTSTRKGRIKKAYLL